METAAPDRATVQPRQPRRILAFTRSVGFHHDAIPYAARMVEIMGKKTGAWETVISDDPEMFRPEVLGNFDAVAMCNTTGNLFMPVNHEKLPAAIVDPLRKRDRELKQSFEKFVRGGGAIIGIHAATDAWYDWPTYGDMIGAYFISHPWTKDFTVGIKVEDPDHPVNKVFRGEDFSINDEIYTFRDEPYSREKLRILLSVDVNRTDMVSDRVRRGMKRKGTDFAISWVRTFGEGRVFYCALGHNRHIFWDRKILQHYLDGIQFALGDLEADTTPSGNR